MRHKHRGLLTYGLNGQKNREMSIEYPHIMSLRGVALFTLSVCYQSVIL